MANTDIFPFGQDAEMPAGYPIEDSLNSNSAQKALSARQGKRLKEMMAQPSQMPSLLQLGDPTNVIYTIDDFIIAHEYDQSQGVDNLKFSNDLGKTWTTIANTYGIIVNAFMFADGTFMMGCKKDEGCSIYWTRDFNTFTEATVKDYDGNTYTKEAGKTRFYTPRPKSEHVYVNGVEHYCFWDYIITTTNPRIWYAISDENGVTVRAAFAFGYSSAKVNGVDTILRARHGHAFEYNPYDGYFYALTGDAVSECHVLKGRYVDNNGTHTWTWERLATGGGYKLVSVSFDEGNLYAVTDYTESALASYKGIVSIPIDKIGLTTTIGGVTFPAKLRYWFHATEAFMRQGSYSGVAALSLGRLVDNHGWRFVGTDYLGNSKHLIAKGDHNFVWVDNDKGVRFNNATGPNNKGDVYVTFSSVPLSVSGEGWLKLSHQQTYNLTEAMRNSGATDFFDGWLGTPR